MQDFITQEDNAGQPRLATYFTDGKLPSVDNFNNLFYQIVNYNPFCMDRDDLLLHIYPDFIEQCFICNVVNK